MNDQELKVSRGEGKTVIIFFSIVAALAISLATEANWMMSKQVSTVLSGKSCKVIEVNMYNSLESVKCDDGIIYTYKK